MSNQQNAAPGFFTSLSVSGTTSSNIARTDSAQSFAGTQTFTGNITNAATTGTSIAAGQILYAGQTGTGTGGEVRLINDAGATNWAVGLLGTAGATNLTIYDLPNSAARLTVNASTGNILIGVATDNGIDKLQVTGTAAILNSGSSILKVSSTGGTGAAIQFLGYTASHTNWQIDNGILGSGINFTPSTTVGGNTFSTIAFTMASAQVVSNVAFNCANNLLVAGNLIISSTAPTITSGFGTSPSIVATSTAAFSITIGSSPGSTGIVALPTAPHGWSITATNITSNSSLTVSCSAQSATSVTLTSYSRTTGLAVSFNASDVIVIQALPF